MNYKLEEIADHFIEYISEHDEVWLHENWEDLHDHAYNMDHYIIGTHKAVVWLGEEWADIIGFIKEYEETHFGEVSTDLSSPEAIVGMYTYIIGERVVACYKEQMNDTGDFEKPSYDQNLHKVDWKTLTESTHEEMELF